MLTTTVKTNIGSVNLCATVYARMYLLRLGHNAMYILNKKRTMFVN